MRRAACCVHAVAVVLLLYLNIEVAGETGDFGISVPEGRVGSVRLGDAVGRRCATSQKDVAIICDRGRVVQIEVQTSDWVTERSVRADHSTLLDVVRAYGKPDSRADRDGDLVLIYAGDEKRPVTLHVHFSKRETERNRGEAVARKLVLLR